MREASVATDATPLLEVADLVVQYGQGADALQAVAGVSLAIARGESLGLVGESGCGKSSLGRALLQLEPIHAGEVRFAGQSVSALRGRALLGFRRRAQMVFQDPFGSLNPRLSVGGALDEVLRVHGLGEPDARRARIEDLLTAVGLDPTYAYRYPHEFSGGQRQRVGIARALAVQPDLIIADEPVSALDVSVQVQILNLFRDLRRRLGLTYLFIAHDLAVVRYVCDRVLVMYRGRIVESGPAAEVFARPAHPYARLLVDAVPDVEKGLRLRGSARPAVAAAEAGAGAPGGCAFAPRCPLAQARCSLERPVLRRVGAGRQAACHFAEEVVP